MITTNGKLILEAGSINYFDQPDILVRPAIEDDAGALITMVLRFFKPGTQDQVGEFVLRSSLTLVDAETGSGSGETAPFFDACQRAVKTALLALNPTITFTIV
jgi:hypothetical protein